MTRSEQIKQLCLSIRNFQLATGEQRFVYNMAKTAEKMETIGTICALTLFRDCCKGPVDLGDIDTLWHIPKELYGWLINVRDDIFSQIESNGDQPLAGTAKEYYKSLLDMLELCQPV